MTEGTGGPEQPVEDWASAELRGDTAFLGGFTLTKEEWLDRHATCKLRYEDFRFDEVRVRHYGETAVMTGRQSAEGKYEDFDLRGQFRATLVLVHQQERWLLAGIHLSPIAGPP